MALRPLAEPPIGRRWEAVPLSSARSPPPRALDAPSWRPSHEVALDALPSCPLGDRVRLGNDRCRTAPRRLDVLARLAPVLICGDALASRAVRASFAHASLTRPEPCGDERGGGNAHQRVSDEPPRLLRPDARLERDRVA